MAWKTEKERIRIWNSSAGTKSQAYWITQRKISDVLKEACWPQKEGWRRPSESRENTSSSEIERNKRTLRKIRKGKASFNQWVWG